VLTNALAAALGTRPASVTDMLKKLAAKKWITYEKYYGVKLTVAGQSAALQIIRKHRLWETFLVQTLGFNWHEVHEVAEQLEHVQSPVLIEKLDAFLGRPATDPHGHPIPNRHGHWVESFDEVALTDVAVGYHGRICSVRNSTAHFLQYLDKVGIAIGTVIHIESKENFDKSVHAVVHRKKIVLTREVAENLFVEK